MADQHAAIVNAIKDHDEAAFKKAIYIHLNNINCIYSREHPEFKYYIK